MGSAHRTTPRRNAFTLIELLVVIAIIGILAAMLFPVFARARESARKTQCLANVKNIAMGIQIYLTDYDRFPPGEHNQEAIDYFNEKAHAKCTRDCCAMRLQEANPYLKSPVILDEYIKSREIWKCPSAFASTTFYIMDTYMNSTGTDNWLLTYIENQDECPRPRACSEPLPSGWGGSVKASIGGHVWCTPSESQGAFAMSIGVVNYMDVSTSAINDTTKYVVCADAGMRYPNGFDDTVSIAYPDMCRMRSYGCDNTCGGDWSNCSQSQTCSPLAGDHGGSGPQATDVQWRKEHAHSRHMGGSNLGFADGHAKWMMSEAILFDGRPSWRGVGSGPNAIENLDCCYVTAMEW